MSYTRDISQFIGDTFKSLVYQPYGQNVSAKVLGGMGERGKQTFIWHPRSAHLPLILLSEVARSGGSRRFHYIDMRGSLRQAYHASRMHIDYRIQFASYRSRRERLDGLISTLDRLNVSGPCKSVLVVAGFDVIAPWESLQANVQLQDKMQRYADNGGALIATSNISSEGLVFHLQAALPYADRALFATRMTPRLEDGYRVWIRSMANRDMLETPVHLIRGYDTASRLKWLLRGEVSHSPQAKEFWAKSGLSAPS